MLKSLVQTSRRYNWKNLICDSKRKDKVSKNKLKKYERPVWMILNHFWMIQNKIWVNTFNTIKWDPNKNIG